MKELFKTVTELAPEFGFQLNEDTNLKADVMDRLNHAASLDEVDTVSFGLETDDGKIVKVYVAEKDAEKFEKIMSQALGKVDDIEEAINLASKEVEIIDVEWPGKDEDDDNPDDELTDDGSEVLNQKVYDNAQANKELEQKLKPRVENMSYGERFVTDNVMTEGIPGGIASRLSSPNQQLILQAVLELGIPEVVLDRSPYRATIIRNIREIAMQLQHNSSMKQALRVFVKRTIDQNAKEEPDQIEEALLTEGNADIFWSAFENALKALDKSRKGLDAEALFNDSKYQNLKKRSLSFLNSKVGTTLRTKLNSLAQAVETMNASSQPVAEAMTGDDAVELVTRLFNMADQSQGKKLAAAVLNTIAAKTLLRRIKQGATSLPSAIKTRLDAVEKELNRDPVVESLKDILASLKTKAKGEEKFAIRVALKVIDRRVDENVVKAKTNDTITEADEVDVLTIEATDDGVKVGDAEFIEENLERLLKALANRETVSVRDTNDKKYIVSPRGRSAVLKQVGTASRIELNPEQVNDLLNAADGSKE